MNLPFESINLGAKIWIFQSDAIISAFQEENIKQQIEFFLPTWSSHGNELITSYQIKHKRFIIIAVDESTSGASGCSIDKLVHFIQNLGAQLQLNLMDRRIAYVDNGNIATVDISQIKNKIASGEIREETPIFNNSITTKEELSSKWVQKAINSWVAKYFRIEFV